VTATQGSATPQELFTPVIPANDTVTVTILEPDNQGRVYLSFSRKVRLPKNASKWTDKNEGGKKLNITFVPTEGTIQAVIDPEKDLKFGWRIREV